MNQALISKWIIGVVATVVWFWGDKLQIPAQAQALAATIVPSLIGYVLGTATPGRPGNPEGKP